MTEEKKPLKLEFAPGCFDSFEGTQEELDELMVEIQRMFDNGEFEEHSRVLTEDDYDELPEEVKDRLEDFFSDEEAISKFGFLLEAFNYGPPPHGGIALGLDRLSALIAGAESIREVIAFPKTASGGDPLTGAPTPITPAQRKEAAIDFVPEPESK